VGFAWGGRDSRGERESAVVLGVVRREGNEEHVGLQHLAARRLKGQVSVDRQTGCHKLG
jgi:hypothetical protein